MKSANVKTVDLSDTYISDSGFPVLDQGVLKSAVVCIRPAHKSGMPQVYLDKSHSGKLISHNYCHSGTGYALLFGTVEKAIENFQKERLARGISFTEEITVVGLGCIGLVTALTLYFRGFMNVRLVGERFNGTASFGAGGLIDFSLSTQYEPEQFDQMNEYFKHSFVEYKQIVQGKHKFIRYGVAEVDYYNDFFQEGTALHYLSKLGLTDKPERVLLNIRETKRKYELNKFRTFHVVTDVFMNSLLYTIKKLNIPVRYRKIRSFQEINSRLIFNCTGLGSAELNNDKDCYPICGHGFVLSDERIKNHGYILRLSKLPDLKDDDPLNGPTYFMPKQSGFIGGTYIKNYNGADEDRNQKELLKVLTRAKIFFNETQSKAKF